MSKSHLQPVITDLLIFCSASSKETLLQCPDDEVNQHVTIGAIVAITAVFSSVAACYALSMVFGEPLYSFAIALVWGLFIFSIDRMIVSTISAEERIAHKLFGAVIRLCLAVFVSITISHPLKLRIYQDEIMQELEISLHNALDGAEVDFQGKLQAMADGLKNRLSRVTNDRNAINAQINTYQQTLSQIAVINHEFDLSISCNCYGSGDSCKIKPGLNGPYCKDARRRKAERKFADDQQMSKINDSMLDARRRLIELNEQEMVIIGASNKDEGDARLQYASKVSSIKSSFSTSLVSRTNSLYRIGGDTSPLGVLITILFLVVETSPVIIKLLAGGGVYGILIRDEKRGIAAFMNSPDKVDGALYKEIERFRIEVQQRHDQMWRDYAQHILDRIKPLFLARFEAAVSCWYEREFTPEYMANELEGWFRRMWANIAMRGQEGLRSGTLFRNFRAQPGLHQAPGDGAVAKINLKMLMHTFTSIFLFAGMYFLYSRISPTPDQKDAVTLGVSLVAIYLSVFQLRAAVLSPQAAEQ
ncbi:MAG: DUF4407 domain-containing protein [Magnetospirillum sp.]|nr:DUF4407 domain-containing protein [Magnetospirillum sp.]